jgi:hypothetical protein
MVLAVASTRVFLPSAGQSVTTGTLHVDVVDVQTVQWRPGGAHFATVRAIDHGETRTLVLSETPNRLDVLGDHSLRLLESPLRVVVAPAPSVGFDEPSAAGRARAKIAALGWLKTPVVSSSLLVFGRNWEISFQLGADVDAVVQIDAATGRIIDVRKRGGF